MENNNYFLIGEVALSHDGSLGQAFKYIDMAYDLGLNAIKFNYIFQNLKVLSLKILEQNLVFKI